jgi:hypothetical protein
MSEQSAIPMLLACPICGARHIDEGEFATKLHHTHACQNCGMVWRPAIVPTVGVQFLPGFGPKEKEAKVSSLRAEVEAALQPPTSKQPCTACIDRAAIEATLSQRIVALREVIAAADELRGNVVIRRPQDHEAVQSYDRARKKLDV